MFLKSIKTYGFKSFADKTEINFNENINGIVGPNGSGKSNVVDAVRWVLGEQSVKQLRGNSSSDVIFSGSKSRKPLNSASVTLIFDNSDSYLPIDYNEVSIKRIMYKSGESEYYLNNERCKLKDITDLLTDSGAGKDAFNIISQGKIDEILSTKARDRREIFESAAGVVKYRRRKEEAIKKLDRTNQNLDRVTDIISELETNLEPLEKQSIDAKRYLEYKDKLESIEIALITTDITTYNNETKQLKEKINSLTGELAELTNSNNRKDLELINIKNQISLKENEINNNQEKLLNITKKIEKISADIRVLKERKKYVKQTDEIENNIVDIKTDLLEKEKNINLLNLELENQTEELNNIDNKIIENTTRYNENKNKIYNTSKLINNCTKEITDLKYKIQYLTSNLENNNNLPNSIKQIFNNPRINDYHNIIGNLIEVEELYNTAIMVALGASSNYLVVDTTKIAKEMVDYLKENKLGRATFYPLDVIKPKNIDELTIQQISLIPGYISIASSLVKYDEKYKNIISNRLGNIIVATDLDSANKISKHINNKYKIVTLDGQEVNIGGSITGGSTYNNSILKDKYELDKFKEKYNNLTNNQKELEEKLIVLNQNSSHLEEEIHNEKVTKKDIEDSITQIQTNLEKVKITKEQLDREFNDLNAIKNNDDISEEQKLIEEYYNQDKLKDNISNLIENLIKEKSNLNDNLIELESEFRKNNSEENTKEKQLQELELKINTNNIKLDNFLLALTEEYNMTYETAIRKYTLEIPIEEARTQVKEIKSKIKNIDYVNLGAIEEYERVKERYDFLTKQKEDLINAEDTLVEIINEMDSVMEHKFKETFEKIRIEFKKVFREMFRGGEAELILTEPDNLLETGIEIQAVPSGKKLKSISLLSGGEKTFTAISLLFAILNVRPVPFCLLDEVEAALDDANVESFGNYLYKYKDKTQFILITHKKKTMEFADVLYGITMQESGVSKLVSVKLEDIKKG